MHQPLPQSLVSGRHQLKCGVDQHDRLFGDAAPHNQGVALIPIRRDGLREAQVHDVVQVETMRVDGGAPHQRGLQFARDDRGLLQPQLENHLTDDLRQQRVEVLQCDLTQNDLGEVLVVAPKKPEQIQVEGRVVDLATIPHIVHPRIIHLLGEEVGVAREAIPLHTLITTHTILPEC